MIFPLTLLSLQRHLWDGDVVGLVGGRAGPYLRRIALIPEAFPDIAAERRQVRAGKPRLEFEGSTNLLSAGSIDTLNIRYTSVMLNTL